MRPLLRGLGATAILTVAVHLGYPVQAADAVMAGKKSTAPQKDLQQALADWGVQFNGTYIGEVLGNTSGGIRTGAIYTGRLDLGTTSILKGSSAGRVRSSTPIFFRSTAVDCRAATSAI
jgi:carbohydrate-selective porin OprB